MLVKLQPVAPRSRVKHSTTEPLRSRKPCDMRGKSLTLYSIITPLKYHVFENIMGYGAIALLEQMLHFPQYFQKYSKRNLNFS